MIKLYINCLVNSNRKDFFAFDGVLPYAGASIRKSKGIILQMCVYICLIVLYKKKMELGFQLLLEYITIAAIAQAWAKFADGSKGWRLKEVSTL